MPYVAETQEKDIATNTWQLARPETYRLLQNGSINGAATRLIITDNPPITIKIIRGFTGALETEITLDAELPASPIPINPSFRLIISEITAEQAKKLANPSVPLSKIKEGL